MIAVYSLEDGSNVEYKISEFMMRESALFKNFFEDSLETVIYLKNYRKEFETVNNNPYIDLQNCTTVESINDLYDVIGYFGLDCLITLLNEHVYELEMFSESDSYINYIRKNICLLTENYLNLSLREIYLK